MSDFQNMQFQQAPQPMQTQQQNDPLSDPVMQPKPLSTNSNVMYCRDCGSPMPKNAVVCVNCDYVMNPQAFRQTQMSIHEQQQQQETAMKIRRFLRVITGAPPEPDYSQPITPRNYRFQTIGAVHCTNCGNEIQDGASVCVNCQYVLNPEAVRRAQMLVRDRTAKLDRKDLIKSLIVPFYGRKMWRQNKDRRMQIAKPCHIAGMINSGIIGIIILLLIIFG